MQPDGLPEPTDIVMASDTSKKRRSEEEERPSKRHKAEYAADSIIKVLVGPDEVAFAVHKDVLCNSSPFFEAACTGRWAEGQEGVVRLPEANPEIFRLTLHYFYAGKLESTFEDDLPVLTCHKVWELAHYLQCPALRNAAIDKVLEHYDANLCKAPSPSAIKWIWRNAPTDSTLSTLIVDIIVARTSLKLFDKLGEHWPRDFLRRVTRVFFDPSSKDTTRSPTYEDRCDYHEHEEAEARCVPAAVKGGS